MREINGLELDNLPRVKSCPAAQLPAYIPYIYHGSRRAELLDIDTVALPLRRFYRRDGNPRFGDRAEIEAIFGISPHTRIVLVGSGRDNTIETWWGFSEKRAPLLAALRAQGVALITGPNYSLFTDEVRYNDMHAMKRIGITWGEIIASGIPAAYHLNARTPHDYRRLSTFINLRPEVTDVAFEFKTGAAWRKRVAFHLAAMTALASRVERPLNLVMIGGVTAIPALAPAYERVTYIDSSAFMNSVNRQRLYLGNGGRMIKTSDFTPPGHPIDDILLANISAMRARIEGLVNGG